MASPEVYRTFSGSIIEKRLAARRSTPSSIAPPPPRQRPRYHPFRGGAIGFGSGGRGRAQNIGGTVLICEFACHASGNSIACRDKAEHRALRRKKKQISHTSSAVC